MELPVLPVSFCFLRLANRNIIARITSRIRMRPAIAIPMAKFFCDMHI